MIGGISGAYPYGGFNMYGLGGTNKSTMMNPAAFDYKAAQRRLQSAFDKVGADETVATMKKDTAKFLDTYATAMKDVQKTAQAANAAVAGAVSDKSGADGAPSAEMTDKAVAAVQSMVDSYNKTQTTLAQNEARGIGVSKSMEALAQAAGNEGSMKLVGITADKNGMLKLDQAELRKGLTGTDQQRKLTGDILGGNYGASTRLAQAANTGLTQNPTSLVSSDLQKIKAQQEQQQDTLMAAAGLSGGMSGFAGMSGRMGAYTMMNMGTVGMLMNMMA